jgi:hypothetical protein
LGFGIAFTGAGFGLIFTALYGPKLAQRRQRLQVEHPLEPWLWRKDWAEGRVQSKTRITMLQSWVFAVFWNAVSIPITYFVVPAVARQHGPVAYLALFFPVIGVFLLIHAIRQTVAFFEFGNTYFQMSTLPGVVGRELKGQIQARFPYSPDHGVHLRLSCIHRNSEDSDSTTETILWREETDLAAEQLAPGPTGTTIPVEFRIPLDAQPTEKRNASHEFIWILEALADVPPVNYHDIFEVPVFRTQQTPSHPEAAEATKEVAPEFAKTAERPATSSIQVRQTAEGTEFYFPAGRNKKFAASATAFSMFFGAVTFFLIYVRAVIIFPLAFGFFWVVLGYIAAYLWLVTSRVVIGTGNLSLQAGLLGRGSIHQIPLSEIVSVNSKINAQQGGSTGVPYYDIELTLRDGKKQTLGSTLQDKKEVAWLVQEMQRLIGPQQKGVAAGMS